MKTPTKEVLKGRISKNNISYQLKDKANKLIEVPFGKKDGLNDLYKAKDFLDRLIEVRE